MTVSPSPDEAAAIVAAVERFVAETSAVPGEGQGETIGPWQRAALVEGVGAKGTVQDHLQGGSQWLS
jgi:hypothetical protein